MFDQTYPHAPGYRHTDTSRQAAADIAPVATTLREEAYRALARNGPMTPDEVAELLHKTVLSIRPRVTELHKLGRIIDTGERRVNASGKRAIVYAIPRPIGAQMSLGIHL